MKFSLIQSLVRVTVKHVGNLIGGGIIPLGSIAAEVIDDWRENSGGAMEPPLAAQATARLELEKVAADAKGYRLQIDALLAEMAAGRSEAERQAAQTYLLQIPAKVQASMRRPEDPTGRTVPPGFVLRKAEDLLQFLPDKMPRFKPGDSAVPGTDLVVSELLGVGGFGEVWKANHRSRPHAPPVALKFTIDPSAARSLRKEVELLDRVATQGRHPGIVDLKYVHMEGDTPCLEYEFVGGGDHADLAALTLAWHQLGKADPVRMAKIIGQVALAVGHAHRLKPPIVHRDLKPQNILVGIHEGKTVLKVADFGIGGIASEQAMAEFAGQATTDSGMTQSAGSCTPLYASPQQRRFGPPDPRDDVYSLGVIWFQMITGDLTKEPPRGGGWRKRFLEKGASQGMVSLLESCLEDDAADRPADARVLADELGKVLRPQPTPSAPAPSIPSPTASAVAPTTSAALPPALEPGGDWFYAAGGKQHGPVTFAELKALVATRAIAPEDNVWSQSLKGWTEAGKVEGLCPARPPAPPPILGTTAQLLIVVPMASVIAIPRLFTSLGFTNSEMFKLYLDGKFIGEGSHAAAFEIPVVCAPGSRELEVAHWRGTKEVDRKSFDVACRKPGEYKLRFNYVRSTFGGMSGSTLEVLASPG